MAEGGSSLNDIKYYLFMSNFNIQLYAKTAREILTITSTILRDLIDR